MYKDLPENIILSKGRYFLSKYYYYDYYSQERSTIRACLMNESGRIYFQRAYNPAGKQISKAITTTQDNK